MTPTLAESWFHTLDPVAFRAIIEVRWYGLSYLGGFVAGWLILRWMAKRGSIAISVEQVYDFMFSVIVGVLLGGRLGYALFYDPSLFIRFSADLPWWELLAINRGGMSSHGGILGVMIACGWFARRAEVPVRHLFDVVAFACPAGLFFGRIANFINGELPGEAVADQATPPPWSVKFPQEFTEWRSWDAATVQAKLEPLTGVVERVGAQPGQWRDAVTRVQEILPNGGAEALPTDLQNYVSFVIDKLVAATQSGQEAVIETMRPLLTAVYPSQLIQALTDGPLLFLALVIVWLKPRTPGIVGCWFFIVYGILRILSEGFRQPDHGVALLLGLSRGRVLSIAMIVIGLFFLWRFVRGGMRPMGGLLRPASPAPAAASA